MTLRGRACPPACSDRCGSCRSGNEASAADAAPDTALADVQTVWRKFLQRKSFYDLTGNGVNHPNDYGHRIYASVIPEVLTGESYF